MSNYIINPYFLFGGAPPAPTRNAWVEIGRYVVTGGETTFNIAPDPFPNKRYLMLLLWLEGQNDPAVDGEIRFNGDAGNNYSNRVSIDGGLDGVSTSNNAIDDVFGYGGQIPGYNVYFIDNNPVGEKLLQRHFIHRNGVGAGSAPRRLEQVSKQSQFDVTTGDPLNPITQLTVLRKGAGDYLNGEAVLLGFDPADGGDATQNFWQPLGETVLSENADTIGVTFSAKKYLWVQYHLVATGGTIELNERFNGDTGNNYANRRSINGGGEVTLGNDDKIDIQSGVPDTWRMYGDQYILNESAKEKLVIDHTSSTTTAGAGSTPWRQELVAKWANTVSQITTIDIDNDGGTGDYGIGSKIKVWGHD